MKLGESDDLFKIVYFMVGEVGFFYLYSRVFGEYVRVFLGLFLVDVFFFKVCFCFFRLVYSFFGGGWVGGLVRGVG